MSQFIAAGSLQHDSANYNTGDPIELDDELAARFAKAGLIETDDDGNPTPFANATPPKPRGRKRQAAAAKKSKPAKPAAAATANVLDDGTPDVVVTE